MKSRLWIVALATTLSLTMSIEALGAERRQLMEFIEFGNPSADTREQVNALLDAFTHSWANQDVDAHLGLFSEDAEWINAYARMFRGTQELAVFLEERLFPNWDIAVSREEMGNARMISVRYLGDDGAIIHMATDGQRGPSAISGESMRRTHLHLVAEKQQGQWVIVHTVIMDARE
jgi:uncharacterized protein (TIGR02246 family)